MDDQFLLEQTARATTVANPVADSRGLAVARDVPESNKPDVRTYVATSAADAHRRSRRRLWWFLLGAVLVCLAGIGLWLLLRELLKPVPVPAVPPIPVVAAMAQAGDVPVYLTGLGTVQAYNTVTVHVRVNGTLDKVVFVEGQDVKAGDLLAQIDPRPYQAQLDEVVAAKAHDEALLADAKLDLQRYEKLAAENSIAAQQRDTQIWLVAQDEATVKNDQAQIDYAAVQLAYTTITSPIAGRTGVRMIDAGNIVQTTDTTGLVVVTQIEPISVLFTLPEDDFDVVNRQMAAGPLTVVASSRADSKVLGQGTVLLINNEINQTTGTIELKATFPNQDHALWPGQFVDAQLLVETRHNAVTVPAAAVQVGPQGVYAYVVKADNTVEMRPIKVSAANPGAPMALIESGVSAGDQVVVDGQLKLRPGASVKMISATPPAASRGGAPTSATIAAPSGAPNDAPASMNISEPFIRRPIGTTLLAIGLLMVGVVTFPMLPVAPLPQVDFPTIQVSTKLPGASAETMAASVTAPLERQFALIAGVTELTSTSSLGLSSITDAVQPRLATSMPLQATSCRRSTPPVDNCRPTCRARPATRRSTRRNSPILLLALTSASLPLTVVDNSAENILAQQLSQISGVAQITVNGQQKPAVRIQLDPAKIASLGLALEDVRTQIVDATADAPKGTFDGAQQSFAVYDNDQILAAAPWNDIIVAYRSGAPVRIRDIGRAVDGPEDTKLAAWANGTRCILLAVYKQPGANVIDTVNQVRAALPHLQASIPAAIDVTILEDRTETIRASVADMEVTLTITIVLVVAVIFLFLRTVWATIIPAIAVPLSLTGTFAVMYLLNYSLDNLSLMGLAIAVGFVVDDAIVMLENIVRYIEAGMTPLEAALKGAGEIGFTIISISLSLVAVFIPLLLMSGIVGRLFREFAITVTVAILISGSIALTLTPMMCSRFLKSGKEIRHGRVYLFFERMFDRMLAGYEWALKRVLEHRLATLCVFLGTLMVTVVLYVVIPKGFFPEQDTEFIVGSAEGAQDISSAAMWGHLGAMDEIIAQDPDVADVGYSAGSSTFNSGTFFINLKPRAQRTASADQIIARLRTKLATIEGANLYLQVLQDIKVGGRLGRTQYQYTLQDADLDELDVWAPKLVAKMQGLKQLTDVTSDQQANAATATLTIDRDRAARFGIQPTLIDATIYDAIGQRQVTQYFTQLNAYHVILEVAPALQTDPRLFDKLYLTSPLMAGQQVPVSTFVRLDMTKTSYLAINHQSQLPSVTVSFNLAGGSALGDAVTAVQQVESRSRCSRDIDRVVPGHGAGLPVFAGDDALFDRRRAARRLPHPRCALRELRSPPDHHLDTPLGRGRRPLDADAVRL